MNQNTFKPPADVPVSFSGRIRSSGNKLTVWLTNLLWMNCRSKKGQVRSYSWFIPYTYLIHSLYIPVGDKGWIGGVTAMLPVFTLFSPCAEHHFDISRNYRPDAGDGFYIGFCRGMIRYTACCWKRRCSGCVCWRWTVAVWRAKRNTPCPKSGIRWKWRHIALPLPPMDGWCRTAFIWRFYFKRREWRLPGCGWAVVFSHDKKIFYIFHLSHPFFYCLINS